MQINVYMHVVQGGRRTRRVRMLDRSHLVAGASRFSDRLASLCAAPHPAPAVSVVALSRGRRRGGGGRSVVEDEEERDGGGQKCHGGDGDLRLPQRWQEGSQQPRAVLAHGHAHHLFAVRNRGNQRSVGRAYEVHPTVTMCLVRGAGELIPNYVRSPAPVTSRSHGDGGFYGCLASRQPPKHNTM